MTTGPALAPGVVLDGKYEIVSILGVGGMGEVYKARHLHLNAFRCVKVMRAALLADEGYRQRFLREARLATQIHHPNIAVVHDFATLEDGTNYMVTEYIDGTTVRQWSAKHGRFPLALAAEVGLQVLGGLAHIHRRGMLHRDISSDNVMLAFVEDDHLSVKIIDLGVAKDVSTGGDTTTTQAGMLVGNPKYMSPEHLGELEEGEQLDARADLYSFGVVLYEMLLGVPPFQSKTPHGYIIKHLTQPAPRFKEAVATINLPPAIEAAVLRALEKDRRKRYADAKQFADALRPFANGQSELTRTTVLELYRAPEETVRQPLPVAPPRAQDLPTAVIDEEAEFQRAWEDGSPTAWRTFLEAAGSPTLRKKASGLLEEAIAFELAAGAKSDTGLREFLRRWPDGRHHLDADILLLRLKEAAAEKSFVQALAADTYVALREFLTKHPKSPRAEEAQRALEERLAFETAVALDSEEAWEDYLDRWSDDRHADDARRRIEELRAETRRRVEEERAEEQRRIARQRAEAEAAARANEPRDFDAAWESGTAAAWDAYLAAHAESPRAAEAKRCRQEATEFELAVGMNTAKMWRAFLKAWPEGRHRLDAEVRLRAAK